MFVGGGGSEWLLLLSLGCVGSVVAVFLILISKLKKK